MFLVFIPDEHSILHDLRHNTQNSSLHIMYYKILTSQRFHAICSNLYEVLLQRVVTYLK